MKRRLFLRNSLLATAGLSVLACNNNTSTENQQEGTTSNKESITEKKETPIKGQYDIIVGGAGPAGVCAAIQAARMGSKVLLVEVNGCLGGTWTAGLLSWILDWKNKSGLIAEITSELLKRKAYPKLYKGNNFPFDVEQMKVLLEEMCLETNNIDIMLHTRVADVAKTDRTITHLITESKSGREAWAANVFIDCTGDGDLAALAGCQFDMGEADSGLTQPFTLLSMISGVNYNDIKPFVRNYPDPNSKVNVFKAMQEAGLTPSIHRPGIYPIRDDLFMVMFNHEYEKKATNTRDVTMATIQARAEVDKLVKGLKSLGGPWENIFLVATAEHIGIREARRIKGLYTVTQDDLAIGKKHEDAVCRVTFGVDVHSVSKDQEKTGKRWNRGIKSQPYDIPLRALISKDIDNLMMAGRNISGDFIAHSSYRVTGNATCLGQQAGKHATKAIEKQANPKDILTTI